MSGPEGVWLEWLWPDGSGGRTAMDRQAAERIGGRLAFDGARVWIDGTLAFRGWLEDDERDDGRI